ncbi:hypothetical protein [Stenotrophomonas sp.]|uniref:hypothetical protein n=1 Tax=Stenotrophomonas sp. TaxID=69392 RepID=UPI0028AFA623|nr:hypothetical protein [Stenotrophomonas sp.]
MNSDQGTCRTGSSRGRLRVLAAMMSVLTIVVPQTAAAGAPVIDITSIVGDIQKFFNDAMVYAKEAKRWEQVKAQIDEARAIFDPLRFGMGLPEGAKIQKVAPDYLVKEVCGKKAVGLGMETVFSVLKFDDRYALAGQQRQICVNIQMMENRKFNETVMFLEDTMEQAEDTLRQIFEARVDGGNTTGGVQATQSDTARLTNELNVLSQQWGTRMQGYDAYISAMYARQRVLARVAFRGDPSATAASDVVQTLALKKALEID